VFFEPFPTQFPVTLLFVLPDSLRVDISVHQITCFNPLKWTCTRRLAVRKYTFINLA
jgi:hypothetical protein